MSGGILVLSANPRDAQWLRLNEEYTRIQIQVAQADPRIKVDREPEIGIDNLLPIIAQKKPKILHFSGHATWEGLYLIGPQGKAHLASNDQIRQALKPFKDFIECVVLNGCMTEPQANSIHKSIPFVIGTNHQFSDLAALAFVDGFYAGVAQYLPYVTAYQMGCANIGARGMRENNIPILKRRERMIPIRESLRIRLENAKDECRKHDVPFRGPHLYMVLMGTSESPSDENGALRKAFDKICPGLRATLDQTLADFIHNQAEQESSTFEPFGFMDIDEFVAANNEAVDERASEITPRHLMLGLLNGDSQTSKLIRKLAGGVETYNTLIEEIREPTNIDPYRISLKNG